MGKPVLCFDFDGTLVDKNGRIHPNDRHILKHEHRALFVPATGRPLPAVRRVFERNGLFFDPTIPFPLILQNGAVVYFPNEELFTQRAFSDEEQAELLAISKRHPQVCCLFFSAEKLEIMNPNPLGFKMVKRFDLDAKPFAVADQPFTKVTYISDSKTALEKLADDIDRLSVETSYSLPTVFELTPAGIDKGRMLIDLLTSMDLMNVKIVAAGDGENDLPLFGIADMSFCPDDSPETIKEQVNSEINIVKTGLLAPMLKGAGIEAF